MYIPYSYSYNQQKVISYEKINRKGRIKFFYLKLHFRLTKFENLSNANENN